MKILLIATLALTLLPIILTSCPANEECNELDYAKYVRCIRKKLRFKREDDCEDNCIDNQDCYNSCNDCNCDYCASRNCESFCSQCCHSTTCSTSTCCHRTCHSQCRTSRCRHECKKECEADINEKEEQLDVSAGNITTIITLHTAINNTNIIDVPISINNTNVNNFTLDSSLVYPEYHPLPEKIIVVNTTTNNNHNCCNVVNQGDCKQTQQWPYINCSYPITNQCGPYCKSPTIHNQPTRNCMNGQCINQMMQIPQPQPRCIYHPIWPYTLCGMAQQPFCGGCYQHYNFPYFQPPPMYCSPGCYDEGYGIGPYYRQGPFYRRSFMHVPPCEQMGNCFEQGFGGPWNPFYPPSFLMYPYNFNGDSAGVSLDAKVEAVDKISTNSTFGNVSVRPPVIVETYVNSTKALQSRRRSNKATVTIEKNEKE